MDIKKASFSSELVEVEMPPQIAVLPRTEAGYPRPFMTHPQDIRVVDPRRVVVCAMERLCGICGGKVGWWICFVGGPVGIRNRVSTDPGFHEDCAMYAMQVCPFIVRSKAHRPKEEQYAVPVSEDVKRIALLHKPEKYGVAVVRSYRFGWLTVDTLGFKWSTPVRVDWWQDGNKLRTKD